MSVKLHIVYMVLIGSHQYVTFAISKAIYIKKRFLYRPKRMIIASFVHLSAMVRRHQSLEHVLRVKALCANFILVTINVSTSQMADSSAADASQ